MGRVPVTVFHISGDIDANTHEQLEAQARQAIQDGTRYLLLDMEHVAYISSYGVRALSDIFEWLRDCEQGEDSATLSRGLRDGKFKSLHLKLVNVNKQVAKTLTTMGVDMFLDIQREFKQAVASF
jgi:anti-anti-sigma regulatory factor